MYQFKEGQKSVGLVFDVSLRHAADGRRIIDIVKEECRKVILKYLEDGQDSFYLYHPELTESLMSHGESVAAISNYQTDGWQFPLGYALLQTLYVLDAESISNRKYLILVTDRFSNVKPVVELLRADEREDIRCEVLVITIGNCCRQDLVAELCPLSFSHINNPSEILSVFENFDEMSSTSTG